MLWNLPHVIPGLTRNLSKRSVTKSPFYAFKRGGCHFTKLGSATSQTTRGRFRARPFSPSHATCHFDRAPASGEIYDSTSQLLSTFFTQTLSNVIGFFPWIRFLRYNSKFILRHGSNCFHNPIVGMMVGIFHPYGNDIVSWRFTKKSALPIIF